MNSIMMHVDVTLADTRIIADFNNGNSVWNVVFHDNFTGNSGKFEINSVHFAELLSVAIKGNDEGEEYERVSKLCDDLGIETELRPIP